IRSHAFLFVSSKLSQVITRRPAAQSFGAVLHSLLATFVMVSLLACLVHYSTPKVERTSSRISEVTDKRRPWSSMFSTSSKARNNRNFAAAYCSASVRARPCEAAQLLIAASKRNTLTAKVVFLSDVTSTMHSVAGALASLARAARLPTK